jgi:hypothetical protein
MPHGSRHRLKRRTKCILCYVGFRKATYCWIEAAEGPARSEPQSRDRKVVARTRVTAGSAWPQSRHGEARTGADTPQEWADDEDDSTAQVIPLPVFDALKGGSTVAAMNVFAPVSQLEDRRQPITTLEGWRRFVDADPPEFTLLPEARRADLPEPPKYLQFTPGTGAAAD